MGSRGGLATADGDGSVPSTNAAVCSEVDVCVGSVAESDEMG